MCDSEGATGSPLTDTSPLPLFSTITLSGTFVKSTFPLVTFTIVPASITLTASLIDSAPTIKGSPTCATGIVPA